MSTLILCHLPSPSRSVVFGGLSALLSLLCLSACATDPISGEKDFAVVRWSLAEEQEIGDSATPALIAEMDGPYADAGVQESLSAIVDEMVSHSPRADDFEYKFLVLGSSVPNALALPGGHIFITRGLLARLHSEAEFVAVLGHELGHAEHRHTLQSLNKGVLLGAPTAPLRVASNLPLVGGLFGATADVVGAPAALLGLSFSRSQELEADERGVYFTNAMGYDPRAMIAVFETLEQIEADESGGPPSKLSIFSTHPLGKDRIRYVNKEAEGLPPHDTLRQDSPEFAAVLKRFQSEAKAFEAYDAARDQFESMPSSANAPEAEVEAQFEVAVEKLSTALDALPNEPLFHILAAELAMFAGDAGTAEFHLVLAESRYTKETPGDGHWKPPLYLGLLRLREGDDATAVTFLEAAAQRFPDNAQIQEILKTAREKAAR